MKNLTIDIGNSSVKLAVFEQDTMLEMMICEQAVLAQIDVLVKKYGIKKSILSSVAIENKDITEYLRSTTDFIELTADTPLPLKLEYETPNTLGLDRIAAAVGAMSMKPAADLLVIDAGTCNTYDFVSADGVFKGGNITPGVEMRLKAMHAFTGRLPEVPTADCAQLLGTSTQTALQCGAFWGVVYEIDGFIKALKLLYPKISVFFTGGYAFYFEKRIKNRIFAVSNLVPIGLNKILIYNDSL